MNKCYLLLFLHRRSQTDVDKSSVTEGGEEKNERSVFHSRSIHMFLESLRGTRPGADKNGKTGINRARLLLKKRPVSAATRGCCSTLAKCIWLAW